MSRVCGDAMSEGASSTGAIVLCAAREERAWSAMLLEYAVDLRQRESATQTASLDAMLAASEQWAQARCAYQASIYEGGSLARLVAALCTRDTLAEWVIDLHTHRLYYGEN